MQPSGLGISGIPMATYFNVGKHRRDLCYAVRKPERWLFGMGGEHQAVQRPNAESMKTIPNSAGPQVGLPHGL